MSAFVVVVGGCVADLKFEVPSFPDAGEELEEGVTLSIRAGGKGLFQAVGCQRLDAMTSLISSVGDDYFGIQISNLLTSVGIDHHLYRPPTLQRPAGFMESEFRIDTDVVGIIQPQSGKQTYLASRDRRRLPIDFLEQELAKVTHQCHVVLMSLDLSLEALAAVSSYARQQGKPILLNASPATDLPYSVVREIDYVISPIDEALQWLGISKYETNEDIIAKAEEAGNTLVQHGAKLAIITLEDKGCVVVDRSSIRTYGAFPIEGQEDQSAPQSSTGARSAFCAGLAVAVAESLQSGIAKSQYDTIAFASAARRSARTRAAATQVREMMETRPFIDTYLQRHASSLEHRERKIAKGGKN